ncbi:MAG: alpha/beta hydrolase, partial [Vulcanimicrobiaceae bacterium]
YPGDATVILAPNGAQHSDPTSSAQDALATTATDAAGRFAFFGLTLAPGSYMLKTVLEQSGSRAEQTLQISPGDANRTIDTTIDVAPIVLRGAPQSPTDQFVEVPVFFATDRQAGPTDNVVGASFLNEVSSPYALSYGRALVTIPRMHQRGELEGSDTRIDLRSDKVNHVILESVAVEPEAEFLRELRHRLDQTKATNQHRRVVVFIHGYRTSFDHAVRVAAQIKYDLEPVDTTVVSYSWPSQNALFGYFSDQRSADKTVDALKTFLVSVVRASGGAEVSVIAHSMGNSSLTQALEALAKDPNVHKPLLDKVIMAAPDVPSSTISRDSCLLAPLMSSMTLYASNHDQALLAAMVIGNMENLAGFRREDPIRAGLANPLLLTVGLDTVDASSAITDFLGHGYFTHDVNILSDIQDVIAGKKPPREHLLPQKSRFLIYWLFTPTVVATTTEQVVPSRCAPTH